MRDGRDGVGGYANRVLPAYGLLAQKVRLRQIPDHRYGLPGEEVHLLLAAGLPCAEAGL